MKVISVFKKSEKGATMLEYMLLAASIGIVALAGVANFGLGVKATFDETATHIDQAIPD